MLDLDSSVSSIMATRRQLPETESTLVAVSGIDASGKGYVAGLLVAALQQQGLNTVGIGVDGWLNLPARRFAKKRPVPHFYHHAIRFDELFSQLIVPLKRTRSIHLEAELAAEGEASYHPHTYDFRDVDIIVLEGIYLLKKPYQTYYDRSIWVECSFETAMERAMAHGQEGRSESETVRAYETLYFPAQRLHFALDDPQAAASEILINDDRRRARGK